MAVKASLCFLSYERPKFLKKAVETAIDNAGTNDFEVIIHDDGSQNDRMAVEDVIRSLRTNHLVEKVIFKQVGRNEGVGKAINTSFAIAEGDYLFKIDQDMIFKPDWLRQSVGILENNLEVALLGVFKYHHDPVDWEKTWLRSVSHSAFPYDEHTHFCGSVFGMHRIIYENFGISNHSDAFAEDWELMKKIEKDPNYCNALTRDDYAENQGFGIGPSTVVQEDGSVRPIHKELKKRE